MIFPVEREDGALNSQDRDARIFIVLAEREHGALSSQDRFIVVEQAKLAEQEPCWARSPRYALTPRPLNDLGHPRGQTPGHPRRHTPGHPREHTPGHPLHTAWGDGELEI